MMETADDGLGCYDNDDYYSTSKDDDDDMSERPSKKPRGTVTHMKDVHETYFTIAKACEALGGELEELLEKLVDIKTSEALVPRAMKAYIEKSELKDQVRDHHYEAKPAITDANARQGAPEDQKTDDGRGLGETKSDFDFIEEIVRRTLQCKHFVGAHEDFWNKMVHQRVLDEVARCKKGVEVYSIKSVEIEPSIFLYAPAYAVAVEEAANTHIDFGVVLEPSGELQKSIETAGEVDESRNEGVVEEATASPTYYDPLCQNPIFVPVETRAVDGGHDDGKLQLVKWSKAIIGKLRSMKDSAVAERASKMTEKPTEEDGEKASGNRSTPTENPTQDDTQESESYSSELPVCVGILIEAYKWEVMFLKMRDDGEWTLVSGVDIGGTSRVVDFCRLLKCLDLIYESRERAFSDFYMALGQIFDV